MRKRITLRNIRECEYLYNNYRGGVFSFERYLAKTHKIGHITGHITLATETTGYIPILNVFSATKYKPKTLRRCVVKCNDSKSTHSSIPLRNIPRVSHNLHEYYDYF